MNTRIQDILSHTIFIVTKYYENDIAPFLNSMHDDVLWLGPCDGQRIKSKKLLIDTFSNENNTLTFVTKDVKAECIYSSNLQCQVLVTLIVDTYYPDGSILRNSQRAELTWVDTPIKQNDGSIKYKSLIRICNISNILPYDNRDIIYPVHFTALEFSKGFSIDTKDIDISKLTFKGKGNTLFYIAPSEIVYISNNNHYATIHTTDNDFECSNSLTDIIKDLPDYFVRCHMSNAVNAMFVKSFERFNAILKNGIKIPIPEKKYTMIRDIINNIKNNM